MPLTETQEPTVEQLLTEEIRHKSLTGRTPTRSTSGYHGVLLPADMLTSIGRKRLSGEVRIYRMYEKLMTMEELKALSPAAQREAMIYWRDRYPSTEIRKALSGNAPILSNFRFYNLLKQLNIPVDTERGNRSKSQTPNPAPQTPVVEAQAPVPVPVPAPVALVKPKPTLPCFNIVVAGTYTGKDLIDRLNSLTVLVNPEKKYLIDIELEEIMKG